MFNCLFHIICSAAHEMSKRKKVGSLFLSSSSSPRQQTPTTERVKRTKLSLSSPKRSVAKRKVHIQSCLRMLQLVVRISEHWFAEQWIAWHLWPLSFVGYSPTTKKRAEYLKRIWFPDIWGWIWMNSALFRASSQSLGNRHLQLMWILMFSQRLLP